ncbi:MAG: KEOPS complex subunit Pcc1 [Candidatus Bathyarchaeota archaeon]|nr:KEOPS complex subunit Pcc1 [Candidatus Bathyarchaeota archaeon]
MSKKVSNEKATAEIHVAVSHNIAEVILNALQPEVESPSSERSSVKVKRGKNGVLITTSASDITALRASLNSYLRWIQGMLDMFEKLG